MRSNNLYQQMIEPLRAIAAAADQAAPSWHRLQAFLQRLLVSFSASAPQSRKQSLPGIYLLGAGPGDAELLTRKGERLLKDADVVLYDNLVNPSLLALCSRRCLKIYVGKRAGQHALTQTQINLLLQSHGADCMAKQQVLVRLKGGCPTIFGRVAEEAQALTAAGLPFAIVPGVTTACAASAYSGIPLTARGHATAVQFLTGQFADSQRHVDFSQYQYQGSDSPTLVVYMGSQRLASLCAGLRQVGWPAETPIALLDSVATAAQQQLLGTLLDIHDMYQNAQQGPNPLKGPTLMIIGTVVSHRMAVAPELLKRTQQERMPAEPAVALHQAV